MEQNLRRIYVLGMNFCSIEVKMCRKICNFAHSIEL